MTSSHSKAAEPEPYSLRRDAPMILGLGTLAVLYLAFGALFALRTPPGQVPDEPSHRLVIERIASEGRIPTAELEDPAGYEALQPPGYYLATAPVYTSLEQSSPDVRFVGLRLATLAIGLPLIPLSYSIAMSVAGGTHRARRWIALGTASFVALVPQHIAMAGAVNNDVPGELAGTATVAYLFHAMRSDSKPTWDRDVILGVLCGFVLLTKLTAIVVFPAVALGVLFHRRRIGEGWPRIVGSLLLIGGIAVAMLSPWLLRNMDAYGEPLGYRRHEQIAVASGQPRWDDIQNNVGLFVSTTFKSFWATLGWVNVSMPRWFYVAPLVVIVGGVTGLIAWFAPRRRQVAEWARGRELSVIAVWVSLSIGWLLWFNLTQFFQAQGRYLFTSLAGIALLVLLGWRRWVGDKGLPVFVLSCIAGLVVLNVTVQMIAMDELISKGPRL